MPRLPLDPYVVRHDLVEHLGHVFSTSQLQQFANETNISFDTLSHAVRATADRLDLTRPNSQTWHFAPWDADCDPEHAFARAAVMTSGTWPTIAGAWSLVLDGMVSIDTPALMYGIRFVAVERVTCAPGRSVPSARERDRVARMMGRLPPALVGRRVMTIGERVCAHVTVTRDGLGNVAPVVAPGVDTFHRQERHRAVVEMFASVRLSGGFNAARDTLAECIDRLDPERLGACARTAKLSVRRRLADAVHEIAMDRARQARREGHDMSGWMWPFDRPDMERWLDLRHGRGATLLDPHREEHGPLRSRHGTRDNRYAPLRAAKVLIEPIAAELEPECWHELEHPDPAAGWIDPAQLLRYATPAPTLQSNAARMSAAR